MADLPDGSTPGPEAQYLAFLAQGRFMLQRSRSSGRYVFYPRQLVPGSGETDLEWVPASGLGTLYAITVNRSRGGNHNVALVDLDEGVRMMSRIDGHQSLPIGTRVQARIVEQDGANVVVFVPHQEGRPSAQPSVARPPSSASVAPASARRRATAPSNCSARRRSGPLPMPA